MIKKVWQGLLVLALVTFFTITISEPILSQNPPNPFSVQAVESVGMTVADMDRAIAFYTNVLGCQKLSDVEVWGSTYENLQGLFGIRMRLVRLALGDEIIELTDYLTPGGRPIPVEQRSNDLSFQHLAIVVSDMEKAYQHLRSHRVQYVSTAPQKLPEFLKAAAGIEAFYFRDPDGHNLEIIHFPPDKGNPKWQQPTQQLFLGIDHTAIAVSKTSNSLKFYNDLLGLKLIGESENYGTQQAHLNNVFRARLRISSLGASRGPGIEFLEYLQPRDGKPFPPDTRPDDLWYWQTTLTVNNLELAWKNLQKDYQVLSTGIIRISEPNLGFQKGFLIRDPDGHRLRFVQK
jgi:catechol 2,3-dioxygenase-like lactoylglutathione lyase family enzyme